MSKNPPHKWHFQFIPDALKILTSMLPGHRRSLLNSLRQLVNSEDPYTLPFVEMLKASKFHRLRKFRVGHYRIIFDVLQEKTTHEKHMYVGTIIIIDIRKRKDAY